MKKSISLKEFSTTPTVSKMVCKDGHQYKPPEPASNVKSNAAMQKQQEGSKKESSKKSKNQGDELFEVE